MDEEYQFGSDKSIDSEPKNEISRKGQEMYRTAIIIENEKVVERKQTPLVERASRALANKKRERIENFKKALKVKMLESMG